MKGKTAVIFLICFSAVIGQTTPPKIFILNSQKIFELRKSSLKADLKNNPLLKKIIRSGDSFLQMKPLSVIDKEQIPPSKDKHDYMSMGKYWWPNPDTKDGLPYIRKDGEINPEALKISDHDNGGKTISAVESLSLAYYLTNDSKYSAKAAQLLDTWFLYEKTRMNPNLNYAQFVPGLNEGRKSGIIDTHSFYKLIDALGLLENSKDWTKADNENIKDWFSKYLIWLQTSKNGIGESGTKNNHGSWYDVQIVSILLFLGRNEDAKKQLETVSKRRVDSQIMEDGKQPEELVRTKGMDYTMFNLKALYNLALLADHVGVDLWNYKGVNNGSLRKALDYFLPYALDPSGWEYKQIIPFKPKDLYAILLLAQKKYDNGIYSDWKRKIFGDENKFTIDNILR